MAAPTVTFDGLNINDGTKYSVMPGANLGAKVTTYNEYIGYDGTAKQANVMRAALVPMVIPLMVMGTSVSDLRTNVAALNTKIDACGPSSPKTLAFDGVNYSIVASSQVSPTLEQSYQNKFFCFADLVLNRNP